MISIITVNKNNAAGLQRTIDSVMSQTSRNYEFVVIDGASTDESTAVLEKHRKDLSYSVSEPDTGIYQAMNKGIRHSTGNYLLFLNSGDWLHDAGVLEAVTPYLRDYDVISGDIDIYDQGKWHAMQSEDKLTVGHFFRLSLYHQVTFISRDLFNRYGLYDESFVSTGDYEFFIRTLLRNNGTYRRIPVKVAKFIADGISNNEAFKELNQKEWKMSWARNFSDTVFHELKQYNELLTSRELLWAKRINKLLPF